MSQTPQSAADPGIPLEHQVILRSTAAILQKEFEGIFAAQTIESFLLSSYDEFAGRLAVTKYLPTFAERFARERLRALALVEGKVSDDRPVVLFLCTHNAGRSQMALGFLRALGGDRVVGWSGGSEPGSEVNPAAVAAMAEVGIDISGEFPKPWTDEVVRAADVVVTMGCGDACPVFPGKRYLDWTLEDPHGQGVEQVRLIRNQVRGRVVGLLEELRVPVE